MNWITPIILKGDYCTLVPLSLAHHDDLVIATQDGELSKLWYAIVPNSAEMKEEIERRLLWQKEGKMLPFAVINNKTQIIVGMTSYCQIDNTNRRLDIGFTWYAKSQQKTALNTTCKLMLLTYAFETLSCIAVGFRVDTLNLPSQKAVERLGARYEGTIRNYCVLRDGHIRDMLFYSILPHEWPRIKSHLNNLINMHKGAISG